MENSLMLLNRLKEIRAEKRMSQTALAEIVGVSRNTISSIEVGQYSPTAKLAYSICLALEKRFEEVFYFEGYEEPASSKEIPSGFLSRLMKYLEEKGWSSTEILDMVLYIAKG